MNSETPKAKRGFAAMSPEKRREIAASGGKSARNRHRWTSEEARAAGMKGGRAKTSKNIEG